MERQPSGKCAIVQIIDITALVRANVHVHAMRARDKRQVVRAAPRICTLHGHRPEPSRAWDDPIRDEDGETALLVGAVRADAIAANDIADYICPIAAGTCRIPRLRTICHDRAIIHNDVHCSHVFLLLPVFFPAGRAGKITRASCIHWQLHQF